MAYPAHLSDTESVARCLATVAGEGQVVEVRGGGVLARGALRLVEGGVYFLPGWPAPAPRPWSPLTVACAVREVSFGFQSRALPQGGAGEWRVQWPSGVHVGERRVEPRVRVDPQAGLELRIDSHPEQPLLPLHDLSRSGLGVCSTLDAWGLEPGDALDATLLLPDRNDLRLRLRVVGAWRTAGPGGTPVVGASIVLVDRQHQELLDEVVASMLPGDPSDRKSVV
jgi:hypothetical protein